MGMEICRPGTESPAGEASPLLLGEGYSHREEMKTPSGCVGLHWLQGTFPQEFLFEVLNYLQELYDIEPNLQDWGRMRYDKHFEFQPHNILVYFDSDINRVDKLGRSVHKGRACLSIPGGALDTLTADQLFKLVKDMVYKFRFLGSRTDIFFDDYTKRISVKEVFEEAKKGNITGFRRCAPAGGDFNIFDPDETFGEGVTFGTRGKAGSGKYGRYYDKTKETGGLIDANRFEFEYTKDRSKDLTFKLAQSVDLEEFTYKIGAYVVGAITFVDRASKSVSEKNISRLKVLSWWQEIIDEIGSLKLRNPKRVKSVEKTKGWVEESVIVSMAMLMEAEGADKFVPWLIDELEKGKENFKYKHKAMIRDYRNRNKFLKQYRSTA